MNEIERIHLERMFEEVKYLTSLLVPPGLLTFPFVLLPAVLLGTQ